MYTVTAVGSLEGASEVQHVESTVSDNFSYTYTYNVGVILAVQILDDGSNDFEESVTREILGRAGQARSLNPSSVPFVKLEK